MWKNPEIRFVAGRKIDYSVVEKIKIFYNTQS